MSSSHEKIAGVLGIFAPWMVKAANIIFSQAYHVVNLTNFQFSTWQFFWQLTAEKIAGKMIQNDCGKRGQPGKCKLNNTYGGTSKNQIQYRPQK